MSTRRMVWAERGRNLLLTLVVVAPIALSAQNIVEWARDDTGLGLAVGWSYAVFFALDAAAGVCVLMTLILATQGERAGAFGPLVWVFALTSAFAGYRHGMKPEAPGDAWWFFPLMSVLGPMLLHLVLGHVRRDAQTGSRRRLAYASASAYRLGRWIPGVGAFAETYCAWRVGRLEGITTPAEAINRYRVLCPAGQWRVLRAMRTEAAQRRATPDRTTGDDTSTPALSSRPESTDDTVSTTARAVVDTNQMTAIEAGTPGVDSLPRRGVRSVSSPARPVKRVPTPERIARVVAKSPDATPAQIAARLKLSERTVQRHLSRSTDETEMTIPTRRQPRTDRCLSPEGPAR